MYLIFMYTLKTVKPQRVPYLPIMLKKSNFINPQVDGSIKSKFRDKAAVLYFNKYWFLPHQFKLYFVFVEQI